MALNTNVFKKRSFDRQQRQREEVSDNWHVFQMSDDSFKHICLLNVRNVRNIWNVQTSNFKTLVCQRAHLSGRREWWLCEGDRAQHGLIHVHSERAPSLALHRSRWASCCCSASLDGQRTAAVARTHWRCGLSLVAGVLRFCFVVLFVCWLAQNSLVPTYLHI